MSLRILVVDDDQTTRLLIADLVRHEIPGATVTCAGDGEEALQRVAKEHPALLILNIMMPGKTGVEVLAEVRAARNRVPVILTSGYVTETELVERGTLRDTHVLFLRKPFRIAELAEAVRKCLRPRRRTRGASRWRVWRPGR